MSLFHKIFAIGFLACTTLVPLIFGDMYPFTMFPMYSDNQDFVRIFEVETLAGESLDPSGYGLTETMLAVRDQRFGTRRRPKFFEHYDRVNHENLETFLRRCYPQQFYPIRVTSHRRGYSDQCGGIVDSDWQTIVVTATRHLGGGA